jgi:hypothetical protein
MTIKDDNTAKEWHKNINENEIEMMMIQQKCFLGTLDRNGEKKESIF